MTDKSYTISPFSANQYFSYTIYNNTINTKMTDKTYTISPYCANEYFAYVYIKTPEKFLKLSGMHVYRNNNYDTLEINEPDYLEFSPKNNCEFVYIHLDKHINIKYYTEDTRSAGLRAICEISFNDSNHTEVLDLFKQILSFKAPNANNTITLYEPDSGHWSHSGNIKVQTLENLYIPQNIISDVKDRIKRFTDQKERYAKFGKPWKLNFMFSGVPGSGKTSLVKALAHYYNKNLYVLQLNSGTSANEIMKSIKRIGSDSILLIEDIDSYFKGRKTEDTGLSFSTFINILDGVSGKLNGLITIVTANYPETLDKAILRPGRIDYIAKFDYPRKKEIRAAFFDLVQNSTETDFDMFYNSVKNYKITMAGIVDYLFLFGETIEDVKNNIKTFIDDQQLIRSTIDTDASEKMYS